MAEDTRQEDPFVAEQRRVWGNGDAWKNIIERIQTQEDEVIRRVEAAIKNGAPAHTVVWIVTNSILRGLNREEA